MTSFCLSLHYYDILFQLIILFVKIVVTVCLRSSATLDELLDIEVFDLILKVFLVWSI